MLTELIHYSLAATSSVIPGYFICISCAGYMTFWSRYDAVRNAAGPTDHWTKMKIRVCFSTQYIDSGEYIMCCVY
ncbi:hypothetical protein EB796_000305 [Bugula neritina]|uniref:Uncharacterized protein n=1 Tax=Bugula neritina TaxID=10212 RepID=A0A7J7KT13_BUGNE|nr:hypothetical protein EB796_000305 [Bugula neritina]